MSADSVQTDGDDAETPRRLSILLVDDEPMMSRAIVRAIGRNHDTVTCGSAQEALALIKSRKQPFDAIVVDVFMPTMNGIQFFEALKDDGALVARLGFMTSGGATSEIETAIAMSGRPLLEKPFTGSQARAFVQSLASASSSSPLSLTRSSAKR